ncbi:hypothetical protein ACFLU5_09025 [Bacteroidota bacterium]
MSETLVLEEACAMAIERIENNTRQKRDDIEEGDRIFRGIVNESGFKISLDIREHVNFLPLVSGRSEDTSSGCLLFLNFQMLWGSLVMVEFWSIIAILFTLFFMFIHNEPLYGWIALILGAGNYIITLLSFNRMVKRTRSQILEVLNIGNN